MNAQYTVQLYIQVHLFLKDIGPSSPLLTLYVLHTSLVLDFFLPLSRTKMAFNPLRYEYVQRQNVASLQGGRKEGRKEERCDSCMCTVCVQYVLYQRAYVPSYGVKNDVMLLSLSLCVLCRSAILAFSDGSNYPFLS